MRIKKIGTTPHKKRLLTNNPYFFIISLTIIFLIGLFGSIFLNMISIGMITTIKK